MLQPLKNSAQCSRAGVLEWIDQEDCIGRMWAGTSPFKGTDRDFRLVKDPAMMSKAVEVDNGGGGWLGDLSAKGLRRIEDEL